MKSLSKFLIGATAAAFISGSAIAGEGFNGFSVGVLAASSDYDIRGSEREGVGGDIQQGGTAAQVETTTTTYSTTADFGAVFVEYTGGNSGGIAMTVGVEYVPGEASLGSKARTDTDGDTSDDADTGTYTAKAEVKNFVTLYFEPTVMINDNIGLYAKGGVAHITVNTLEDIAKGAASSAYGDADAWGGVFGGGIRLHTNFGVFLKAEATKTQFQSVEFASGTGNKNVIKATPESTDFRVALGYNF